MWITIHQCTTCCTFHHNSRRTWSQTTSRSDTNRQQYSKGNNEPTNQTKTQQSFWHAFLVARRPYKQGQFKVDWHPGKTFNIRLLHETSPSLTPSTLNTNIFICKRTKFKHDTRMCWNLHTSKRPKKHRTSARYIKLAQSVSPVKRPARYLNYIQLARPERLELEDH